MYNTTGLKDIIDHLNEKNISKEYRRFLALCLIRVFVGNLVPGVMYELEDKVSDLSLACNNMRLATINGNTYLLDEKDIKKLYAGRINRIRNYLRLTDGVLEVVNNGMKLTYDRKKNYRLTYYGASDGYVINNIMFYNDAGVEYYRVNRIKSGEGSYVNYSIQKTLHRVSNEKVLVNESVYMDWPNGFKTIDEKREPYLIDYSGENLSLDLTEYSQGTFGAIKRNI